MRLKEVYIEVMDDEYGITPTNYDPGQEPNRRGPIDNWDAGSGPEMDFPDDVLFYANGAVGKKGVSVPWNVMVLGYGADNKLNYEAAEEAIKAKCYEDYEDFDDEPDYPEPDYDWEGE
jgi:hypothetical protein